MERDMHSIHSSLAGLPKFYSELVKVTEMYYYEPDDELTIKHINEHMQSKIPGPYRLYYNVNNLIEAKFDFKSPEDQTWWYLKWT